MGNRFTNNNIAENLILSNYTIKYRNFKDHIFSAPFETPKVSIGGII
jgi:hypothetical protein